MFGLHPVSFTVAALLCGTINAVAAPQNFWQTHHAPRPLSGPTGWPHLPQNVGHPPQFPIPHLPTQGGFVDHHLVHNPHGPNYMSHTVPHAQLLNHMDSATGHHGWAQQNVVPRPSYHHDIHLLHGRTAPPHVRADSEEALRQQHLHASREQQRAGQAHRNHETFNREISHHHFQNGNAQASAHYNNIADDHARHALDHDIISDAQRRASLALSGPDPVAFQQAHDLAHHARKVYESLNTATEHDKAAFNSYHNKDYNAAERYDQSANRFRQAASDASELSVKVHHAAVH